MLNRQLINGCIVKPGAGSRQIADDFFMNESYLSDLFKRETGSSFTTYLTKFRVEQAKNLLKQLDLKTYEIAEMVGYKNSKYFNKIFKRMYRNNQTRWV